MTDKPSYEATCGECGEPGSMDNPTYRAPYPRGRRICHRCKKTVERQLRASLYHGAPLHTLVQRGGIFTVEELAQTPDAELLALDMMGPIHLSKIRALVPYQARQPLDYELAEMGVW